MLMMFSLKRESMGSSGFEEELQRPLLIGRCGLSGGLNNRGENNSRYPV
jgi:hypothetical protein